MLQFLTSLHYDAITDVLSRITLSSDIGFIKLSLFILASLHLEGKDKAVLVSVASAIACYRPALVSVMQCKS